MHEAMPKNFPSNPEDLSQLVLDLAAVDREIASAARALVRHMEQRVRDPDGVDDDPFAATRRVTGKSMVDALLARQVSSFDAAHRDALVRWARHLTFARLTVPQGLAWERESRAPRAVVTDSAGRPQRIGYREAFALLLAAESPGAGASALAALADAARGLAPLAIERAERRVEAARRFGLAHPDDNAFHAGAVATLRDAARVLLAETDDLANGVLRDVRTRSFGARVEAHPWMPIAMAIARDAPEGWPARLGPRFLDEHFARFSTGLRLAAPALPDVLGAASFARALHGFGVALRRASVAPSWPFAVAFDPASAGAHTFGALFSSVATSRAFYVRCLGTGAGGAAAQARVLTRTALFHLRTLATRVLLADDVERPSASDFDEATTRLFGAPLPKALHAVWPRRGDDELGRFVGAIAGAKLAEAMVQRFDEDWFRNPEAARHLRTIGAAPERDTVQGALGAAAAQPSVASDASSDAAERTNTDSLSKLVALIAPLARELERRLG
jgi:hypothetical protein